MTVREATRKLVRERAKYLCEYCHSSEEASAAQFAIDHILCILNQIGYWVRSLFSVAEIQRIQLGATHTYLLEKRAKIL
jgi:hypothetical protein